MPGQPPGLKIRHGEGLSSAEATAKAPILPCVNGRGVEQLLGEQQGEECPRTFGNRAPKMHSAVPQGDSGECS